MMKKATNSALMRIRNEKIVLSLINRSPLSRADISKLSGLTKAAVTIIVDDLIRRGIVAESDTRKSAVGRSPVMLEIVPDSCYFVGVNITRRDISVGICDLSGHEVMSCGFDVCDPEKAFSMIGTSVTELIKASGIDRSKIKKLALSTPGPVDREKGMILSPPNFKKWHGVHVVKELSRITGFEIVFENVSSATALAEKYFGAAVGCDNFLSLLVDEGIGSGIVKNGSLFKGPCEFGHISIKHDGQICDCGNRGCLEKYASVPQILSGTSYKSWKEVVDSKDFGIIEKEAEYLSSAIISANNIFDFDKVILCGEISYKADKISEMILARTDKNRLLNKPFEVLPGTVGSKPMVAASVAVHDFFN